MMWDGGYWGMGGWLGLLFMVLVLAAVVVGLVFLIRYLVSASSTPRDRTTSSSSARPESAEEILKRRYAAGEIDRDEYLQRLDDLRRQAP